MILLLLFVITQAAVIPNFYCSFEEIVNLELCSETVDLTQNLTIPVGCSGTRCARIIKSFANELSLEGPDEMRKCYYLEHELPVYCDDPDIVQVQPETNEELIDVDVHPDNRCKCRNTGFKPLNDYLCESIGVCGDLHYIHVYRTDPPPTSRKLLSVTEYNIQWVVNTGDVTAYITPNPTPVNSTMCVVTKGSWSNSSYVTNGVCAVNVPLVQQSVSAYIYCTMIKNTEILSTYHQWSPGRGTCDILGGIVCCNREHFWCSILYGEQWWWILIFAGGLLLILFFPSALMIITLLMKLAIVPFKIGFYGFRWVFTHHRTPEKKAALMALIMMFGLGMACDNGGFLTAAVTDCVNDGANQICNVMFNSQVILPHLHSKACFTIVDENNTIMGTLNISYEKYQSLVSLNTLYYTSPWSLYTETHHQCPSSGPCSTANCNSVDPNNPTCGSNSFVGPCNQSIIQNWVGTSGCGSGCACAGCGCFYCTVGCVFYRWAAVPTTTVYKVLNPYMMSFQPVVNISLSEGRSCPSTNGLPCSNMNGTVIGAVNMDMGNWHVEVFGTLMGDVTYFAGNKVIQSGSTNWYGAASESNAPIAGAVGDIQAPSANFVNNPGRNAFLFPKSSVGVSVSQKSATFSPPTVGTTRLDVYPTLPIVIGGTHFAYANGALQGVAIATAPAVEMQLSTISPVMLHRIRNQICPVATFINATGCCNCQTPALIYVSARSTCLSGLASVRTGISTCFTLITSSVLLTTVLSEVPVYITATCADVSGSFIISANGGNASVNFSFLAYEDINIDVNDTVTNQTNFRSYGRFDLFGSWFPNLANWLSTTLTTIFYILLVAAAIAAAVGLFILVRKLKARYGGRKYQTISGTKPRNYQTIISNKPKTH
jgi:hypothetical protein